MAFSNSRSPREYQFATDRWEEVQSLGLPRDVEAGTTRVALEAPAPTMVVDSFAGAASAVLLSGPYWESPNEQYVKLATA